MNEYHFKILVVAGSGKNEDFSQKYREVRNGILKTMRTSIQTICSTVPITAIKKYASAYLMLLGGPICGI